MVVRLTVLCRWQDCAQSESSPEILLHDLSDFEGHLFVFQDSVCREFPTFLSPSKDEKRKAAFYQKTMTISVQETAEVGKEEVGSRISFLWEDAALSFQLSAFSCRAREEEDSTLYESTAHHSNRGKHRSASNVC